MISLKQQVDLSISPHIEYITSGQVPTNVSASSDGLEGILLRNTIVFPERCQMPFGSPNMAGKRPIEPEGYGNVDWEFMCMYFGVQLCACSQVGIGIRLIPFGYAMLVTLGYHVISFDVISVGIAIWAALVAMMLSDHQIQKRVPTIAYFSSQRYFRIFRIGNLFLYCYV